MRIIGNSIAEKFKVNSYLYLAIAIVLAAGIFLRTYNFHNWLRFNADQGRDAELVSAVVDGKAPLPLLGPKAGGTTFKLGPAFYYFEIISAKIFGNAPDKMAYPDLAAGILCIPLLFFFLRKYFEKNISLLLTAIFALSEFAIRWARFAWNPNATPMWTLLALYALHEVISKKSNRKFLWSLICGSAIGIGVQLHTMLLLFFPITLIVIFSYLFIKKNRIWKYFFIITAIALILNVPQIAHEYLSHGENIRAFFGGVGTKQADQKTLPQNFLHGNSAIFQIVPNILTGYEISDNFEVAWDKKHINDIAVVVFGALFVIASVALAVKYYKEEKDAEKKAFLAILALYSLVAYAIFVLLAFEISVRMYLVVFFVPYFFLGFWYKFLKEKLQGRWIYAGLVISAIIIFINLFFVKKYFEDFASYANGEGTVDIATLGETEKFAKFIDDFSKGAPEAFISGDKKFLFVTYKSIWYLVGRSNLNLAMVGQKDIVAQHLAKVYYIVRENKLEDLNNDPDYEVTQQKTYGKFTILLLEKK